MRSKQITNNSLPEGVSWEEVIKLIKGEKYEHIIKKIRPSTLKFVLEDTNKPIVIQALIKALIETDPENATEKYAESIFHSLQEVSRTILKQKS